MRFVVGGIMHETHTFSAERTTLASFVTCRGDEVRRYAGVNHSFGGVLGECDRRGIDVVPTFFADAVSSGVLDRRSFDAMADELVSRVALALPADGVVISMHGAMVAEGHPGAEEEVLRRLRTVVGGAPIAVTLDLHANLGQGVVDLADIVVGYDTYPHVDAAERAAEAVALLHRTVGGRIRPTTALAKPPMLVVPQAMFTAAPPMRPLIEQAFRHEASGRALVAGVYGGFPYSDVPNAGLSFLATTDDRPDEAAGIVTELARTAWSNREAFRVHNTPPAEAVAAAIRWPDHPVVLVDIGDNIGGGAPGDGTVLLGELLAQGARDATIVIADPEAAGAAGQLGVGHEFSGWVGGKSDRLHGDPVKVTGRVLRVGTGDFVHEGPENAGLPASMGLTAVVRADGVNLILASNKVMPGDLQQLRSVGIEPADQQIIVVKAAVRWRGGYQPVTRHSIDIATPGLGDTDLSRFCFASIRRPIWPLDPQAGFTA